jgi:hypothetical protein
MKVHCGWRHCADLPALGGKNFRYQMVPVTSRTLPSTLSQMSIYATPKGWT